VLKGAEYGAALRAATRAAYNLGTVPNRGDEFLRREHRRQREREVIVQRSQLDRGLARAQTDREMLAAQDAEAGLLIEQPDPVAIRVRDEVMAAQVRGVASAEAFERQLRAQQLAEREGQAGADRQAWRAAQDHQQREGRRRAQLGLPGVQDGGPRPARG